ncbi:TetR/AcrR family transcriptional regulator [Cryobacterium sp. TMT1-66-1]|nr:TetR/AcrR family transcriptional regulator [Cryobacterium sp. TMT1-66-1]
MTLLKDFAGPRIDLTQQRVHPNQAECHRFLADQRFPPRLTEHEGSRDLALNREIVVEAVYDRRLGEGRQVPHLPAALAQRMSEHGRRSGEPTQAAGQSEQQRCLARGEPARHDEECTDRNSEVSGADHGLATVSNREVARSDGEGDFSRVDGGGRSGVEGHAEFHPTLGCAGRNAAVVFSIPRVSNTQSIRLSTAIRKALMDETPTPTPRRRPLRTDVRADILRAATEQFFESGYLGTKLDDVATRAGYTKGAVYSNFGSKQALFGSILNERLATLLSGRLATILGDEIRLDDAALARIARRLAETLVEDGPWHLLLMELAVHAARNPQAADLYRQSRQSVRLALGAVILERADQFGIDPAAHRVDVLAPLVMSATNILALERILDPDYFTNEVQSRMIEALLVGTLR